MVADKFGRNFFEVEAVDEDSHSLWLNSVAASNKKEGSYRCHLGLYEIGAEMTGILPAVFVESRLIQGDGRILACLTH